MSGLLLSAPSGGVGLKLVASAERLEPTTPYDSPDANPYLATGGIESAFRVLDSLLVQYIDNALANLSNRQDSGSLPTVSTSGTIGGASYSLTLDVNYSLNETTTDGTFSADDSAGYSYSFHDSGTSTDGMSFTLDDWGSGTSLVGGDGTDSTNALTGTLTGSDTYSAVDTDTLTNQSGDPTTFTDTTSDGHSGSESFSLTEMQTESLDGGGAVLGGDDNYTWDEAGSDSYSLSDHDFETVSNATGGGGESATSSEGDHVPENHSLHILGEDSLGADGSYTSGDQAPTWDLNGDESETDGETVSDVLTTLAGGGSETDTDTGGDSANDSVSLHETGTAGYSDAAGSLTEWATLTDTSNESDTDTSGVTDTTTEAENTGAGGVSESDQDQQTDGETDHVTALDTATLTINAQVSHGEELSDGLITGGYAGFSWSQTLNDTDMSDTMTDSVTTSEDETANDTSAEGGDTSTENLSDIVTGLASVFTTGTNSSTITQVGTETLGFGGVILGGAVSSLGDHEDPTDTVVDSDTETDTFGDTDTETDTVAGDVSTDTLDDDATDTDSTTETDGETMDLGESGSLVLAALGVVTGGSLGTSATGTSSGSVTMKDVDVKTIVDSLSLQDILAAVTASDQSNDDETDSETTSETDTDSGTLTTLSQNETLGLGGIITGGSLNEILNSTALFSGGGTDNIAATDHETDTETDSTGGDDTSESLTDEATDGETDVNGVSGGTVELTDSPSMSFGTGGRLISAVSQIVEPLLTLTQTDTDTGVDSDTEAETGTETDSVGQDRVTDTLTDGVTDTASFTDSLTDSPSSSMSEDATFGPGGVLTGGTIGSTDVDTGCEADTGGDDDTETDSSSESDSDTAGGDSWNDVVQAVDSVLLHATDSSNATTTMAESLLGTLGIGGIIASAYEFLSATESGGDGQTTSETDGDVATDTYSDQDEETGEDDTDHRRDIATDSTTSTLTDTPSGTALDLSSIWFGAGGVLSSATLTETDHESDVETGPVTDADVDTVTETVSDSVSLGSQSFSDDPSDSETDAKGDAEAVDDSVSEFDGATLTLGSGGTISAGISTMTAHESDAVGLTSYSDSGGETSSDTSDSSVTEAGGSDTDHLVAAAVGALSASIAGLSVSTPAPLTTDTLIATATETLGTSGTVTGGNDSESFSESVEDVATTTTETTTETTTDSPDGGALGGAVTDVVTATTTETEDLSDLAVGTDTEQFGSGGTITAGTNTYSDDNSSDSMTYDEEGSGTGTSTDSSGNLESLSLTVNGDGFTLDVTIGSSGDELGTGATIADGSLYQLSTDAEGDSLTTTALGSETFTDDLDGPNDTATLTKSTTDAYDSTLIETDTETLGTGGTIVAGTDTYHWDEGDPTYTTIVDTGAHIGVSDTGLQSYGFDENGTETLDSGGSVTEGEDGFTWDDVSTDCYSLSQGYSGTGTHSYTEGLIDSVSNSWHDVAGDSLGESGSITDGTDDYGRDTTRSISYGVTDQGDVEDFGHTHTLIGSGTLGDNFHDVGCDSLDVAGDVTGTDAYTWDETSSDSSNYTNVAGTTINGVASDDAGSDTYSLHDVETVSSDDGSITSLEDSYTVNSSFTNHADETVFYLGAVQGGFGGGSETVTSSDAEDFAYTMHAVGGDVSDAADDTHSLVFSSGQTTSNTLNVHDRGTLSDGTSTFDLTRTYNLGPDEVGFDGTDLEVDGTTHCYTLGESGTSIEVDSESYSAYDPVIGHAWSMSDTYSMTESHSSEYVDGDAGGSYVYDDSGLTSVGTAPHAPEHALDDDPGEVVAWNAVGLHYVSQGGTPSNILGLLDTRGAANLETATLMVGRRVVYGVSGLHLGLYDADQEPWSPPDPVTVYRRPQADSGGGGALPPPPAPLGPGGAPSRKDGSTYTEARLVAAAVNPTPISPDTRSSKALVDGLRSADGSASTSGPSVPQAPPPPPLFASIYGGISVPLMRFAMAAMAPTSAATSGDASASASAPFAAVGEDGQGSGAPASDPLSGFNPSIDPGGAGTAPAGGPDGDAVATAGVGNAVSSSQDGDEIVMTDALGETTAYAYDDQGRRVAVTDGNGDTTRIAYNGQGEVLSVTDPDGNTTTYAYDDQGRLQVMTDPLGGQTRYTYDAAGNVASVTDPDNRLRTFAYDDSGRLIGEDWYDASGQQVDELRFAYDASGRLVSASNAAGTYTYAYDAQGRLAHETEPFDQWLDFSYSPDGSTVSVTDSAGGVTVSTYDTHGDLLARQVSAPGEPTLGVAYTYDLDGNVTGVTRTSDGVVVGETSYTTDDQGDVVGITNVDGSGDLIDAFLYTYDADGRVTSEMDEDGGVAPALGADTADSTDSSGVASSGDDPGDSGATTNYTYDASGQLIGDGSQTYTYDANGNRTGSGDVIGPDNRLLSDGTWDYTYDADGNRIGKTDIATGVSWSYAYDDANRMTSATETDADGRLMSQVTYRYDVFGNRIEQVTSTAGDTAATVLRSAYVDQQVWADLDGTNHVTTRYLDGAAVNAMLARATAAGAVGWYLTDRLGSVRAIVDEGGTVEDAIEYGSYGEITSESDPAAGDRFKFAGMQSYAMGGFYYDHARYYDPNTGTWTSQDPMGHDAGDANLYRYVGNDPVDKADPNGLRDKPVSSEKFKQLLDVSPSLPPEAATRPEDYGKYFERLVLTILKGDNGYEKYIPTKPPELTSGKRTTANRGLEPEVVADVRITVIQGNNLPEIRASQLTNVYLVPKSYFIEMKRLESNEITLSDTKNEVAGYLDYLGNRSPAVNFRKQAEAGQVGNLKPNDPRVKAAKSAYPVLHFITTSDTTISPKVINEANKLKVVIVQSILMFDDYDFTYSVGTPAVKTNFDTGDTIIINEASRHYFIKRSDIYKTNH